MRRNVARDIWRAVVVAGAMLAGAGAGTGCSAPVAAQGDDSADVGGGSAGADEQATKKKKKKPRKTVADAGPPIDAAPPAPDAAPRPRKVDDGPRGRGFLLA